jgi:hypothetical protein
MMAIIARTAIWSFQGFGSGRGSNCGVGVANSDGRGGMPVIDECGNTGSPFGLDMLQGVSLLDIMLIAVELISIVAEWIIVDDGGGMVVCADAEEYIVT